MGQIKNKVAIITGTGSGMGAAIAMCFARNGAHVVATDINIDNGNTTVDAIKKEGLSANFIEHDVANENDWVDVVESTQQVHGKVDILINNAAILIAKKLEDTSVEEWDKLFNVNTKSVFLGCKQVLPVMRNNGGGAIVNIASMFSQLAISGMAAYITSKSTIKNLTQAIATEFAADNIRVNSLHPGLVETPMVTELLNDDVTSAHYQERILLSRPAKVEEIAQTALFLASDAAAYMTGSALIVDGGYTAN